MDIDESLIFKNQDIVNLDPKNLYEWLNGSATNSSQDEILPQQQLLPSTQDYPLSGREESLRHIAQQFQKILDNRSIGDRNTRPLPICTGIPGLGKSRLCIETGTTVFKMLNMECVFAIISFGNDGNAYGQIDERLGIQCAFAWRVFHSFFKAQHNFEQWM